MKLDARALALADPPMTGPDVDRLHEELSQLGDPYRKLVGADLDPGGVHRFGKDTSQAVAAFQEKYRERLQAVTVLALDGREDVRWSGEWGIVDPATAQVINEVFARITNPLVIHARVEYEDGRPAAGIRVAAFDRGIDSIRQELGKKEGGYITNSNGLLPDIQYFAEDYEAGEGLRGASADLVFEVADAEKSDAIELVAVYRRIQLSGRTQEQQVADLVLGYPASPVETVRLVVRRSGETKPSEYERLMAALNPLLIDEVTPARFDQEQHRDYTFAARETGTPEALIEILSQAWKRSGMTGLPPEAFYGLIRRGSPVRVQPMSPDLTELLSYGATAWETKLTEALDLQLIPTKSRDVLRGWLDRLQALSAQSLLNGVAAKEKEASLADVLGYAGIADRRC
jgi:hypothetical protein